MAATGIAAQMGQIKRSDQRDQGLEDDITSHDMVSHLPLPMHHTVCGRIGV
jgi:hypothetical protein